jgi:hypothetical protein
MEVKEINKHLYVLIDYNRPHGHERLWNKPVILTEQEAHSLNQGFALNGQSKRYVRSEL